MWFTGLAGVLGAEGSEALEEGITQYDLLFVDFEGVGA